MQDLPRKQEDTRPALFHERVAQHAADHPEQGEYWIHTEAIASGFILSMAAALKLMGKECKDIDDRSEYRADAARYRHAVAQRKALELCRELCEEHTSIHYCGMRLRVPTAADCARWPNAVPFNPMKGVYDGNRTPDPPMPAE